MPNIKKETKPRNVSRLCSRSLKSPKSLNAENRSVEFIAATETPVTVFDWDTFGTIDEVLLMAGCILPKSGAVPLLDTHSHNSVFNQLGSFREIEVEGTELIGRAYFSSVQGASDAFSLVKEGHLTDVSVGYNILEYRTLRENEVLEYEGKEYVGPLRLVTAWQLNELSLCPIGADENAKVRGKFMPNRSDETKRNDDLEKEDLESEEALEASDDLEDVETEELEEDSEDTEEDTKESEEEEKQGSRAVAKRERKRCLAISAMCRNFDMSEEFERNAVSKGLSINAVRASILNTLEGRAMPKFKIEHGLSESEKVREVASQAFGLRCGLIEKDLVGNTGKLAGDINHYRSMSLREMCRDFLVRSGQSIPSDVRDMVGRALTTTDLPVVLTETINRVLQKSWQEYEGTWKLWCGEGDVTDFKPQTILSAGLGQTLSLIPEGGEYEYMQMAEHAEKVSIATYGKKIAITRQAIINDDLSVFTAIPRMQAQAAARTINKLAYDVLTENSLMGDGKNLFHNHHGNLISGVGGIPSVENLGKVVSAMKKQKDVAGNILQIQPKFFIAPVALETAAETFFSSNLIGTQASPNQNNIYAGSKFTRVFDAMLDDHSPTSWFLAGAKGDSVNLYFLNGNSSPRLEQRDNWHTDGVELKVSIDAAAKASGWQALAKAIA